MLNALGETLRNLKIRHKIILIFVVLFLLMLDLGALNVTSVADIRSETKYIADTLIPRLLETTAIKDRLNGAILSAYDYVQTGNSDSKDLYEQELGEALVAQINLFYLSSSEADFQFTTSFQNHINDINNALEELVETYESGGTTTEVREQLITVAERKDAFTKFLQEEIEIKVKTASTREREKTDRQVNQTIINVGVVGLIALISLWLLFSFTRKSITEPVKKLTDAAESASHGEFQYVDVDTGDELGLFADTFNTMTQHIKATQEALTIELEKTKQLDRQKTEFLSIAAHQLRTPMSGIKWVVSMAVEGDLGKLPAEATEQLAKGLENIERMIRLINSLLDVTQIETQKFTFDILPHEAVQLVTESCADLDHAAQKAGVTISINKPKTPLPLVAADAEKFGMALHNLVDNAIKYTKKGGTVSVDFTHEDDEVIFHIKDTGYGIPKAEQDRIFTKFYRGSNIQTIQADGSGLGLYIVREIVNRHEGKVDFESEEGKGTTFSISLPVASDALIAKTQDDKKAADKAAAEKKEPVKPPTTS